MRDPEPEAITESAIEAPVSADSGVAVTCTNTETQKEDTTDVTTPVSPGSDGTISPTKLEPSSPKIFSTLDPKQAEMLGMQLEPARSSSLSMLEVAAQKEKPGVMTPSRKDTTSSDHSIEAVVSVKARQKPEPPKARRWRGRRAKEEDEGAGEKLIDEPEPTIASSIDRRESAEETLAIPTLTSRSTSRPPPALPPPRRSFLVGSSHHLPVVASTDNHYHKSAIKPEPPKTRRWRHGTKLRTESSSVEEQGRADFPNSIADSSTHQTEQSESVEVALQKATLG
jgi:hypothetical protein